MNYGAGTNGTQPREIRVRVRQTGVSNPATETFVVTQNPARVLTKGNAPFWQWGRKDPMPPSTGFSSGINGERQLWYGDDAYAFGPLVGPVSIGTAVRNPFKIYYQSSDWCSTSYSNLWDAPNAAMGSATYSDITIIKSVYDPNPVGFNMPPSNAWTCFTLTEGPTSKNEDINISNARTYIRDGGYRFYTQDDGKGPAVLYQITGTRFSSTGRMGNINHSNYCFSALPATSTEAQSFGYSDATIRQGGSNGKCLGASVRPVTD
jgi:hypothetical protein